MVIKHLLLHINLLKLIKLLKAKLQRDFFFPEWHCIILSFY